MRRATFLESANENLLEILEYITEAGANVSVATAFVRELRGKCHRLAAFKTTIGRPRTDIGPGICSFPYKGYLIVLRYADGRFEVVNIFEGHRDIKGYFAHDHRPSE